MVLGGAVKPGRVLRLFLFQSLYRTVQRLFHAQNRRTEYRGNTRVARVLSWRYHRFTRESGVDTSAWSKICSLLSRSGADALGEHRRWSQSGHNKSPTLTC